MGVGQGFVLVVLMTLAFQLYSYATTRTGVVRQTFCRRLGIGYLTLGIAMLISRQMVWVMSGLVLMMAGLRLVAHGLDRLEKNIFIDRYHGDQ